ncbi:bolA-like protein 3 isoform X1 [Pseudonaja textilis]|uniref:bolA-like protein 3 isoform X1 n=1 Tax=Pseudonaja textilis TaxID=8673 RepID=UPI000EA9C0EA|nr:bolA-like protein 3 isoform X1 [Pseudonaja textilis]
MAAAAWFPACRRKVAFLLRRGERSLVSQTEGEIRVTRALQEKFPQAVVIKVVDISGGCGAMYEIHIESEEFKEKRTIQQHQMVNQLFTMPPSSRLLVKKLKQCMDCGFSLLFPSTELTDSR